MLTGVVKVLVEDVICSSSSSSTESESSARLTVLPGWNVDIESSSFLIDGICSAGNDGISMVTTGSDITSLEFFVFFQSWFVRKIQVIVF